MHHTRRRFLAATTTAVIAAPWAPTGFARKKTMNAQIARDMLDWDGIDNHRTGSTGDRETASWLAGEIRAAGLSPEVVEFDFSVRRPGNCRITGGKREAFGVPLFDGGVTEDSGVSGLLGELGSQRPVGLAFYEPFAGHPDTLALREARSANRHQAIVAVAAGATVEPGLTLLNADDFDTPFGPPVLQVATEHGPWLRELAAAGATVSVKAPMSVRRTAVSNVQARIRGSRPELAPLVVMTRGGRYVSLLGSNPLFHHPDDRWPGAVDPERAERLAGAMLTIVAELAVA